jgi:hypothetical protein
MSRQGRTRNYYRGVREVAARLGVSPRTANLLLRGRRITCSEIGGAYRVTEAAIREFEQQNTFAAAA